MTSDSEDSDYFVEAYVAPDKVGAPLINDERADILGNFDDSKRHSDGGYKYPHDLDEQPQEEESSEEDDESTAENDDDEDAEDDAEPPAPPPVNTKLTREQITALMKGASKSNRFVLYVTNLDFGTTKESLENYFTTAGEVKGVRIPRNRRGGFAFVEMNDIDGFQRAFELHNTMIEGRTIKIQISEAGKKKSANKKNIMKQKNRKLAEMRNESKKFTKSGKNYDKGFKKEMEEHKMQELRASGRGRGRGRGMGRGRGASRGRGRGRGGAK